MKLQTMERTVWASNRRSILRSFGRSTAACLTDRYDLAVRIGRNRNLSPPSESTSRRSFHNTGLHNNGTARNNTETHQAYPLSGYYSDLLSFHQPPHHHQQRRSSQPQPPPSSSTAEEPTKEQKLSIVFGTRLAGPGYQSTRYNPETTPPESTWRQINGVPIPPRPTEPDNCCMSGCVHCVWDDYRDDLEHWASRVRDARLTASVAADNGAKRKEMRQTPRKEVASASTSMDDDGGGSEANWELPAVPGVGGEEDLFKGIPVGIREFMKIEKKLREKKRSSGLQP
ncbi:hypothetical protein DPV78_000825 [Talaromyces pinophilus]|nr:hypothetical protein DPV78_000825 [Talaromyces pinophilus]